MAYFLQQLINGLTLGSIYGLIAIGYTMVYGIIGMINFAHGEIYMIGAFIAVTMFLLLGFAGLSFVPLALLIVLIVAMLFTALYGWAVERIAYRPLRGSFRLAPLISAIGMSIFLQNYVQITQGARVKPMPPLIQGGFTIFESGGFAVQLSYLQLAIMVYDAGADARLFGDDRGDAARPVAARLRAGHRDGLAARHRCRPGDFRDVCHGSGAGRGRRADGDAVLRRRRFLHRVSRRGEGVHRGRARRHRLAAGGDARRPA